MSQRIQRVNWGLKYTAHLIHGRKSPIIDKIELRSEIHRALDSEPRKSIIDES